MTSYGGPNVIDMPVPQTGAPDQPKSAILAIERVTFVCLVAVLIFGLLAFGATEAWSQFIQRTIALALFGLWIARQHLQNAIEITPSAINLPVIAFAIVVLLQLITGNTAYRYATLSASLNLVTYGALMLVAADVFARRRRLRVFVYVMGLLGFGIALFAILQGLSGTDKIYWFRSPGIISAAIYGPYVNHNHYAGLMEMLIPMAGAAAFLQRGPKQVLLSFAAMMMALSVIFSRSRGGIISLATELLFVCFVLFWFQRNRRGLLIVLGLSAAVAALVLLLGTDKVFQRLSETQDAYRFPIYRDCLQMALHRPILGYGFGTFSAIYPAFRSFYTDLFVNHAHNDYLEVLVETGIVGLSFLLWMLMGVFRAGFRKLMDPHDYEGRMLTLGLLAGIFGVVVHSFLDFNLHIPANAALFFVMCAAIAVPFKHRIKPLDTTENPEFYLQGARR
jgi:hypothetical protein